MPKKPTQKNYFGEEQEQAVVKYLQSDSQEERNKIFNEYLKKPLTKMVDSITRRYKLQRKGYEYNEQHVDTTSFLMTKIDKFDPTSNFKAYSYFGTICKNYLMGAIQKDVKDINRSISYDDICEKLDDSDEYSYRIDNYEINYQDIVRRLTTEILVTLENDNLNENELKIGNALIQIFENIEIIFENGDGNKFNKNLVLLHLREMTHLSTKEIRVSLRKFKKLYNVILKKSL